MAELNPNIILAGDTSQIFNPVKAEAAQNDLAQQRFNLSMNPVRAQQAQQELAQGGQKLQAGDIELQQAKIENGLKILSVAKGHPEAWASAKQMAIAKGFPAEMIPDQYDDKFIDTATNALLDAKTKFMGGIEQQKNAETARHNAAEEFNQGGGGLFGNTNPYAPATPSAMPSAAPSTAPLSVRNNNPLNMKDASTGAFNQYTTPEEGMSAAVSDLTNKISGKSPVMIQKFGANYQPTLSNIIETWSPQSANKQGTTQAYVDFVSKNTGIDPNAPLKPEDAAKIAPVMAKFEAGNYADKSINPVTGDVTGAGLTGDEFLKTLNPQARLQVKAMAEGKVPFPSQYAMAKSPVMQKLATAVLQYDPTANAQRYDVIKQFDAPNSKTAQTLKSFNVLASHLDTLDTLATALDNGDVQMLNSAKNAFGKQFGGTAPTNFDAAKKIVADEVVKAVVGSGGGVADREAAQNDVNKASTPAQLKGVIATYKDLVHGQLKGVQQQYEVSGRTDFNDRLSPEARAMFEAPKTAESHPLDKYMK